MSSAVCRIEIDPCRACRLPENSAGRQIGCITVMTAFGTKQLIRDVRYTVAFGGKADVARTTHFSSV